MRYRNQKLPFEGLIVLELGQRLSAAACGTLLASAGATVIVAEPGHIPPSGKFCNRPLALAGKRSIVVIPGQPDDDALLAHAAAAADVIIMSSDMENGLVAEGGPDTIVCDVTALPKPAERSDLLCDKLVQALTGIAAMTGTTSGSPALSDAAILEFGSGIYAAAAVVAALRVRRTQGGGQRVCASMYGAGVNALTTFLPFHFSGHVPPRAGNRHPMCAPWNAYKASDGWLLLCSANDEQWKRLCTVMDRPELATGGPMAKLADRVRNVDDVDAAVQGWVGSQTVDDAVAALGKAGIAAGAILGIDNLSVNPNVRHRKMLRRLRDPEGGADVDIPGPPLALGRAAGHIPARDQGRAFVQSLVPKTVARRSDLTDAAPLAGLRVLEIGQYTTAPLAAKQMAAMGADVIKVEPLEGEASRAWPPHLDGESYFFTLNNTNKRSLAVDLRTPEHQALFADLVRTSDVLVENLKPGSLARLGFSFEELERLNPRLVYCAISGYGQDSVYPGRPAFDTVIQAMSGLMDLTRAEGVPTKLGISIADTSGGMMGLFCILAMLEARDQSGRGAFIDLAMQDVGLWATQNAWLREQRTPHAVVRCSDGDVAVIGNPDAVQDALASAGLHAPRAQRSTIVHALVERGIPAAEVRTIDEVGISEQRPGGLIRLVDTDKSRWPLLELPFKLSRMPTYELKTIGALGKANAAFATGAS